MLDRIKQLEKIARTLDPDPKLRSSLLEKVIKYSDYFLNHIYDLPAYTVTSDKGSGLYDSPIDENGTDIDSILALFRQHVDRPGLNPASGGHLGYIPGGGIFPSALGDYLADVTNRFAGVFYASPGAVRMENMLLEWMASVVGYPKSSGGNLTSGGSIANLIGVVAARDAFDLKAKDFEKSVIYLTEQAHHSVDKAIRIAGLKECVLHYVAMNQHYRMNPSALDEAIQSDKKAGLNPFLIIAAAGTTDVGAVDPLDAIADIAQSHSLWLHVDGAYGAFFILCDEGKKILKGIERSDSLVMDPHKGLFLPYGSGAALIRDKKKLHDAFWYQANYLREAQNANDEFSPADLSPELTKHFRGMRLWLPLKLFGVGTFRAAIEEKLLLARYFHEKIQQIDGFQAGSYPDLSVVTFRYRQRSGDVNKSNEQLLQECVVEGRVFIYSTVLEGNYTLRLAVLSFRTHLSTVDLLLDLLKEKATNLEKEF